MEVLWIPTSREVYFAIRAKHGEEMTVHGTITDLGEYTGSKHIMTEWGLPGADVPIVKRDDRDDESRFYLAVVTEGDDE